MKRNVTKSDQDKSGNSTSYFKQQLSPSKIYEAVHELRVKQEAVEARLPKIPFAQVTSSSPKKTSPYSKLLLSPFNGSVDNNRRFDFSSIRLEPLKKIWRRN